MIRVELLENMGAEAEYENAEAIYLGLDLDKFQKIKEKYSNRLTFIDYKKQFIETEHEILPYLKKLPGELSTLYSKKRWNRLRVSESNFYVLKSMRKIILYFVFLKLLSRKDLLIIVDDSALYRFIKDKHPDIETRYVNQVLLKPDTTEIYSETFDYVQNRISRNWRQSDPVIPGEDITLIQVYTNYNLADKKNPFKVYYDDLDSWLTERGETVWFLVTVLEHEKYEITRAKIASKFSNTVFVNDLLSMGDILKIGLGDLFHGKKFPSVYVNGIDTGSLFEREEISGPAISNKIAHSYFIALKNFLRMGGRVKKFIYIMENKCWERNSIMAFRKYSPDTFIIGYQHTQLPEFFGYTPDSKLFESYEKPDRIVCTGDVAASILRKYWGTTEIVTGPALRNRDFLEINEEISCMEEKGSYTVGVAGPMFLPEARELLTDILEIVEKSDLQFRILYKIHPVTSEDSYLDIVNSYPLKVRQCLQFFKGDIKTFFSSVNLFVSAGTTMELQAALLGIFTIFYVSFNNFEYTHKGHNSNIASDSEELGRMILKAVKERISGKKADKETVSRFYNPINSCSMKGFLK